jgi:hypothetical protein
MLATVYTLQQVVRMRCELQLDEASKQRKGYSDGASCKFAARLC